MQAKSSMYGIFQKHTLKNINSDALRYLYLLICGKLKQHDFSFTDFFIGYSAFRNLCFSSFQNNSKKQNLSLELCPVKLGVAAVYCLRIDSI